MSQGDRCRERWQETDDQDRKAMITGLRQAGARFHQRGWSLGTSCNYSVRWRRDPVEFLITASGKDKRQLQEHDFVQVDGDGLPVTAGQPSSSAETPLHTVLYEDEQVGAVLHTHSVWATLLSERFAAAQCLEISGYEMLKGLSGVVTHEHVERIAIFENTQDFSSLAADVRQCRRQGDERLRHAYLIRRHGLYTWGRGLDEAERHVEVLEFLFECLGRELMFPGRDPSPSA